MNDVPGLAALTSISPRFAHHAEALGRAAWNNPHRRVDETAAVFLGCDLSLGLLDFPLRTHVEMARRLGVPGQVMIDVIVELAPLVGYPLAAQALTSVAFSPSADHGASGQAIDLARRAAVAVRRPGPVPDDALADIVGEYGALVHGE
ncbi:hypothetical protein Bra3105_08545 [Brachybacterium halotolerans subsp. kimchii]|uniref:hypothetical protein n=1 Tax=Brachybacterium halotolerans TaxID=2795215 RepID=UPI001E41F9DB|nr:hypothetical protein [Brachybacterium halotolerans]UEJ84338.1 hypothetical protein Bra3105_08545 [Brachybacterium halotolerans subsp. kimchii]